jgi:hypothetical protein
MAGWSLQELAQAESGPGRSAWEWLEAVRAQAPDGAWRLMDPDFRLVMAQGWIIHNEDVLRDPTVSGLDRDTFARELSLEQPTHPLWPHFAKVMLREITRTLGGLELENLGIAMRPRLIGADLELVRLLPLDELDRDEDGQYYFAPGAQVIGLSVILRHREPRWLVAGIGEFLYHPGWPPRFERVVRSDD